MKNEKPKKKKAPYDDDEFKDNDDDGFFRNIDILNKYKTCVCVRYFFFCSSIHSFNSQSYTYAHTQKVYTHFLCSSKFFTFTIT